MKRKIFLITITTMLLIVLGICLDTVKAKALEKNRELFVNSNNITVTDNSTVPTILKDKDGNDVETTFDLGKNGVLLSSDIAGSNVQIAKTIRGNFETEFRVYSDTYYYDESGSDWNSAKVVVNPYCDLEELTLTFTDLSGQSFDVIIAGGEKYNTITPAARVKTGKGQFGNHYSNDATVPSENETKNAGGYFTRIGGTTFSNVTRRGGVNTSDSKPITVGFNRETMEVYVYHYGITKHYKEGEYRVVADLDSSDLGLNKLSSFGDYNVTITFNSIASKKTAKMLVYSINGQSLSGEELVNSIGPETTASFKTNSVVGTKYYLPSPSMFDLLDDNYEFKTIIEAVDAAGNKLNLYSFNEEIISSGEFSEGCYISSKVEGDIKISYTSYDSDLLAGKTSTYKIYNYGQAPVSSFDFESLDSNYLIENRSLSENFSIYPCKVQSALYIADGLHYASVSLFKDGVIYKNIDGKQIANVESVLLEDEGSYKLVYFIDGFYNEEHCYEFTVTSSIPKAEFVSELFDKYIFGSKLDIPTVNYALNNTTKKGTPVLYDPNGKQINTKEDIVLDQIGTYKLTYLVKFEETYTFDYYFTVCHSASDLFTDTKGISTEYGNTGGLFNELVGGTVVTATKNDAYTTYNKMIDLSSNTKNDSLIEIITLPSKTGVLDAWQYTIKLTDAYNEKNYVTITVFKGSWGNEYAYVKVGSSSQVLSGLEMGNVLTAFNTGTPINYSMTGESILGTEVLGFYYDNEEKAIYVDNIKRAGYSYGNLVIDMDDPQYFSEKTLWDGFTTGEVYLSLSVQYLQEEKAQFLIKSINGVDFGSEWINDDNVPVLSVDTLDYEVNSLPKGLINTEYSIFDAKAYDALDGKIDYSVSVYKDYQTIKQKLVYTGKDSFNPTEAGNYSIVYTATDSSKNMASKVFGVEVVDSLPDLDYLLEAEIQNSVIVGNYLQIPEGVAVGGSGNVYYEISIKNPQGVAVDIINNEVFIDSVGEYKLTIYIVDYLGIEKEISYNIASAISENPTIGKFAVNTTMIEGYEYDLSSFNAIDYFSNYGTPVEAIKKIEIVQNGQTKALDSNFKYTPEATTNNEEITIRFIANSVSGSGESVLEVKAHLIKLLDGDNNYNLANLFYQKDITSVTPSDKYIEYTTDVNNASLEYVNYLVADGFNMNFTVNKDMNNFGAIEILLQDSLNANQQILLTIYNSGTTSSKVTINDLKNLSISSDFYQTTAYGFKFYFNAKSNAIVDGNTNKAISVIKNNLNGSVFEGFTSGKIKVTLTYKEVTGDSSIRISSISNQALTNDAKDRIAPAVQLMDELKTIGEINESFTVYRAVAADGVDPNPQLSVRIIKNGKDIYSGNIDQDYEFIPTEYGEYTIAYNATDSNNRKTTLTYILTVKDRIKPEITVNGKVITEAKVGKTYTLPTAEVSDNNDTDLPVYLFILAPDGELRAKPLGDYSFNPTLKGEYRITYYVQDSYNCYTYVEYIINVS